MLSLLIKSQTNKNLSLQEIQELKTGLKNFFDESWRFEIDFFDLEKPMVETKKSSLETKPKANLNPTSIKTTSSAQMKKTQSKIHQIWQGQNKNLTFDQREIDELSAL
jgi:short-subunit dehydrogenase involved in D-alanine esterification of teichoic acids